MLRSLILTKGIHTCSLNWSSSKAQLLKLRKKTGYPFENCKKALLLNDHNLEKSEIWLKEEAQRLGLAKANKLVNRPTVQGVIALAFDKQKEIATMVEVNCETDFVARNKYFHSIVDVITFSCLDHAKKQKALDNSFAKINLESKELMKLSGTEGKSLADHVAITIGNLGENITLRRAMCLNTQDTGLNVMGLTHPSTTGSNSHSGKYGSLLIYRKQPDSEKINQNSKESSCNEILRQMCQHIIGMNPKSVGLAKVQEPLKSQQAVSDKTFDENNELSMDEKTIEIEHQEMLEQTFLLDPTMTFAEVATYYGIDVLDFVRYECGEI